MDSEPVIKLTVKEKSLRSFLSKFLVDYDPFNESRRRECGDVVPLHLLSDTMFLKKGCGIESGELLLIELMDVAQNTRKDLKSTNIYKAYDYDDLTLKLVLVSYTVEPTQFSLYQPIS